MNPTVLIFGASGGFGSRLAAEFRAAGWTVVGPARFECDLADPASVRAWLDREAGTRFDACVFAAGASEVGRFDAVPADAFRTCLEVNGLGPLSILLALARRPTHPCHRFIVVLSGTVHLLLPGLGPYSLGKRMLRDALYLLRADRSLPAVRVLEVWPGPMATAFNANTRRHGAIELPAPLQARPPQDVARTVFRAFERGRTRVSLSAVPWLLGAAQAVAPGPVAALLRLVGGRGGRGGEAKN